jgi:TatD DNase family protein
MTINYFDAHSHLNFSQFDGDREECIKEMQEAGIWTITVGTDKKTSEEAVLLAEQYRNIYATIGIHPTDVATELWDGEFFSTLVRHPKVVAIGECGLDCFRISPEDTTTKTQQRELFEAQIAFAHIHELPLMIHGRPSKGTMDAYEDILEVLNEQKEFLREKDAGDVHFFAGTSRIAEDFLSRGFAISFDGPITFTDEYNEAIRVVPQDMLLAETDSPFAAPAPFRGKRNQPAYVAHIIKTLADIRGEDTEEVRQATVRNTKRVFAIKEGE